ncbi:MAG: PQQ-dependent sugar dehydrogenase, partial [Planctomycetota bacterium]|nr:PQQ-dependent sugar dehydrogenase [Planctomycetota bacterium]
WRSSFDRETGDLYIADVGQNAREEIDYQPAASRGGENYGWDCEEGTACANSVSPDCAGTANGCSCGDPTLVNPIHEYTHSFGVSITGGYVYRGCAIPSLLGTYFFGDFGSARIWTFKVVGGSVTEFAERTAELDPPGAMSICCISAFGEDAAGEIYIVDRSGTTTGEVYKIVPETPTIPPADFNCDGSVGILDLLSLLAQWGPCDGCLQDLDGDGQVGIFDLLTLLAQWG